MNGYDLTRAWYNFKFENPEKCRHIHSDLFFYIVDQWNRLGQKNNFGLPTSKTMESIGIGSYNTYKKAFDELVSFGFIRVVKDSNNQHCSRIVAISKIDKATAKALDKATDEPTAKPTDTIIEQKNKRTKEQIEQAFLKFWDLYDKKVERKSCLQKFSKLSSDVWEKIFAHVPLYVASTPEAKYRKNPETYLNGECWNDEVKGLKDTTNLTPYQKSLSGYVSQFANENY